MNHLRHRTNYLFYAAHFVGAATFAESAGWLIRSFVPEPLHAHTWAALWALAWIGGPKRSLREILR